MSDTFIFGIYPGGATGSDTGAVAQGAPESIEQIEAALAALQGDAPLFVVRAYQPFQDANTERPIITTPAQPELLVCPGRALDLVLQFQSRSGDVDGFVQFVRRKVRELGPLCRTVQVCEEPNLNLPLLDGSTPRVREAVVRGVLAAKDEARAAGLGSLLIGFNGVPAFQPEDTFWAELGQLGGAAFAEAVDYVGLDCFPDVFRPVAPDGEPGDMRQMLPMLLHALREQWMPRAGLGAHIPIHIAENGWPTSPTRSYERQAQVLEQIIRIVYEHRAALNIAQYELFDLRDADSSNPDIFYQFGLMRDDYTPKPAFHTYQRLIAELGAPPQSLCVPSKV